MNDMSTGRPLWLRVYGGVVQPLSADCRHAGHLSMAAGSRGLGVVMIMAAGTVAAVLVVSVALLGAWSWRRTVRPAAAADRQAGRSPSDLETVHIQLRREFATVAGVAVALPASVTARVPLLDDRIGIAAHSTDRLLETVRRTPTQMPIVGACVRQARLIGAAVVELHHAVVAAKLDPASDAVVDAVERAAAVMDSAVDGLYVEVTTAIPPSVPDGT